MRISDLWDVQVLLYVALTAGVTLIMLVLLAIITRRVRVMASELESVRHELRLLEDGVRTVNESLQARRALQPTVSEVLESAAHPEAKDPRPPDKPDSEPVKPA